jgi:hypothetical protein
MRCMVMAGVNRDARHDQQTAKSSVKDAVLARWEGYEGRDACRLHGAGAEA